MGFANEKDHPEVAPSQFEMNYAHSEATVAADQAQLYKLLSRQVAARMEMTASFLPKPVAGVNGNGMHTNISFEREGRNLFWDPAGQDQLSASGWRFAARILERQRSLSDPQLLGQRLPAARSRLRAPNQIRLRHRPAAR